MDGGRFLSPELPYESRYFSVLFNEKGNIIFTDTGKVASIDTGEAVEYAQTIREKGPQAGSRTITDTVFPETEQKRGLFFWTAEENWIPFRT